MHSFKTLASLFLLASISVSNAYPTDAAPESSIVERGLTIAVGTDAKSASCPYTNNNLPDANPQLPARIYAAHDYTQNQVKKAMLSAAQLQVDDKQIGAQGYPHAFGNGEKLPFPCGSKRFEFPIQPDNDIYSGGAVTDLPDRVVYEYSADKTTAKINFCGVMRHGPPPANDFLLCKS
ncbi:hypothetical protein G7Y89_g7133 [Cudoniella acicularis]|uniref:ribonuclease T1 n=1 Tax=Cudoniella acicularis TaxID=354080 RepID=A0A8H4W1U0_9HELO|nr:hypothetical protein G7Y89_g7133 [Cudoniella acicularis]